MSSIKKPLGIRGILVFLLILPFLSASETGRSQIWKGKIYREGDVVVVLNPKEPIHREPVLSISLDWTIGGSKAEGPYVLGAPRDLAVDGDGNVYILDLKKEYVTKIDASGRFVAAIGGRGQGPGEFSAAFSISFQPKTNLLSVAEISGRLSQFRPDGRFLRMLHLMRTTKKAVCDSTGKIVFQLSSMSSPSRLIAMNPDGTRVLWDVPGPEPDRRVEPFNPRGWWIVNDDDSVISALGEIYEIDVYDSQGKRVRKIVRYFDPVSISKSLVAEYRDRPVPPGLSLPNPSRTRLPAFRSFFSDDRGHVFVQTWERTADGRQDIYDIFDKTGRFFGRVPLNLQPDLINPNTRLIRNNKLYVIEKDSDGLEVIRRYSVRWLVDEGGDARPVR